LPKVLAAIQVSPEAVAGGAIGKIRDGDCIEIDAESGALNVVSDPRFAARELPQFKLSRSHSGMGRELFAAFRHSVNSAENGASIFGGQ